MATLVAVGGAAVGAYFGQPQLGWVIGSIVGNLLFPEDGPDTVTEGPRLGDLTVMSSAYGAPIPLGYGTVRLSGNVIWSTGLEEVKTTDKQSSGGKGGGGATQSNVTYEYFSTFALALAEGVADDVLRIWADGRLIFDKVGAGDDTAKTGLQFRFYDGGETQEPDGLIEADKGVNQTPAFRGLCYMVFERLALKDYGRRLPNITVELTFKASTDQPTQSMDFFTIAEGGLTDAFQNTSIRPDFVRGVLYFSDTTAKVLRRAQVRTMKEDRQKAYTLDALGNSVTALGVQVVLPSGFILATTTTGNTMAHSLINPDTLGIVSTFGVTGALLNYRPTGFEAPGTGKSSWIQVQGLGGLEHYALMGSIFNSVGLLRADNPLTYVWDSDSAPNGLGFAATNARIHGTCPGAVGDGFGEGYVMAGVNYVASAKTDDVNLYKVTVRAGAFYNSAADSYSGVEFELVASLSPSQLVPGETALFKIAALMYDETDDTIMMQVTAADNSTDYMIKVDPTTATVLWSTVIPGIVISTAGYNHSRIQGGVYGQMDGSRAWAIRTSDGEVFYDTTGWALIGGVAWWDSRTNNVVGQAGSGDIGKWLFFRGAGQGEGLDVVVSDLVQRSGLAASDIDVTGLAGQTVPGYIIGRQSTVRGSLQPLASLFFFDGVESDYLLKFTLRDGKSVSATITQPDLIPLDETSGEILRESRTQEVELPVRFTVTYMDKDNDYKQNTHNAKRLRGPVAAMNSRNEMGLQIAAALSTDFAKQVAEKALYSSWIERSTYSVQLPWTFLALDPSDIVTITLDDGTSFRTRFIQVDVGVDFALEVNALSEDAAQYTSNVVSDPGSSGLVQEFLTETATKLILLPTPLLRDSDDVGRTSSVLYFFMGGFGQPGWTAGTLFKSAEGSEYTEVGSVVNEMVWGSTINALGDTTEPFATDETNTLTVFLNTGTGLSSTTQLEMLNGANAAAVVHSNGTDVEIIQFRDVVLNTDGSWTLSGLLRGRRGTEVFTAGHTSGDTFILLSSTTGDTLPLALGEKGLTRFYKAVTTGGLFEKSPVDTKASPLNDLKPYAVVQHKAAPSGNDIDLSWVRRTRVGGGLQDGTGIVPLNEDSEEYELEIYDGPGGSLVRTVLALSTPSRTYTSAEQSTDGFSPPLSQLTVRIYQISAQVGRGFSKEVTLDVE